jgi:hypothetical protein
MKRERKRLKPRVDSLSRPRPVDGGGTTADGLRPHRIRRTNSVWFGPHMIFAIPALLIALTVHDTPTPAPPYPW